MVYTSCGHSAEGRGHSRSRVRPLSPVGLAAQHTELVAFGVGEDRPPGAVGLPVIGHERGTDAQQPLHLLLPRGFRAQAQVDAVLDRLGLGHLVEVQDRTVGQQHLGLVRTRFVLRMQRTAGHLAPEPSQLKGIRTVDRHVLHHRNHARQHALLDGHQVEVQQSGHGTQVGQAVSGAQRPVVTDAAARPRVGPLAGVATEVDAAGGVADLHVRTVGHHALRGHQCVAAVAGLADAEQRHRAGGHVELHRHAPATLAVEHTQAAQQRFLRADRQVRRTVVTHLHVAAGEVERLELGERPACAEHVHDQHGHAGAQLVLAGRRDAARGQQAGAQDHPGAEPFVLLAVQAAVVVGEAVEVEVGHQPVEPHRDLGAPREVLVVHRLGHLEDLRRLGHSGVHFGLRDLLDAHPQVVELQHLHVAAEVRVHHGQVGGDVVHAGVEVAHQPVAAVAQHLADAGRAHPALDLLPGPLVTQVAGHAAELDPRAGERVGHLRQRARAAVGEPLSGVDGRVVHRLGGLQVDEQHGCVAALCHRHEHGGRQVGGEEPDDEVAAGLAQLLGGRRAFAFVGDEPDVDDLGVVAGDPFAHVSRGLLQRGQQVGELRPVRAEPAGDQADLRPPLLGHGSSSADPEVGDPDRGRRGAGRSLLVLNGKHVAGQVDVDLAEHVHARPVEEHGPVGPAALLRGGHDPAERHDQVGVVVAVEHDPGAAGGVRRDGDLPFRPAAVLAADEVERACPPRAVGRVVGDALGEPPGHVADDHVWGAGGVDGLAFLVHQAVVRIERVDHQPLVDADRGGERGAVVGVPRAAPVVAVHVTGVVVGEPARRAQHPGIALAPRERRVQPAVPVVGQAVQVHVAGAAHDSVRAGPVTRGRRPLAELAPGSVVLGQFEGAVAGPAGAVAQLEVPVGGDHEPRVADAAEVNAVQSPLYGPEVGE